MQRAKIPKGPSVTEMRSEAVQGGATRRQFLVARESDDLGLYMLRVYLRETRRGRPPELTISRYIGGFSRRASNDDCRHVLEAFGMDDAREQLVTGDITTREFRAMTPEERKARRERERAHRERAQSIHDRPTPVPGESADSEPAPEPETDTEPQTEH